MRIFFYSIFLVCCIYSQANAECTEVNISAHPNYPPFHWREGDTLTGASIAVTVEILKSMGVAYRVSYEGPWKRVLKKAQAGTVDIIPALKDVAERREYLAFTTTPFYFNPVAVFVRADDTSQIETLSDLDGRVGSINLGDKHGSEIDRYVAHSDTIQQVYGLESNFVILDLGRTDFFISGLYTGRQFLATHPLKTKIKVATQFEANWVHHGFAKNSDCIYLLERFDRKLHDLYESGFVGQKMNHYERRWLSAD